MDGAPAGLVVVERRDDHALILSVAVNPSAHGRGLGRMLIAFAETRAAEAGLPEVRLYTNALMERNIRLYERLGYREAGRRRNPRRPAFIIVDMVKKLAR